MSLLLPGTSSKKICDYLPGLESQETAFLPHNLNLVSESKPEIPLAHILLHCIFSPFLLQRGFASKAMQTNELFIDREIKEKVSGTKIFRPQVL